MENKMKKIIETLKVHKVETITVLAIVIILIVFCMVRNYTELKQSKKQTDFVELKNAIKAEEVKESENIVLEVNTEEYEKDEEVAIIMEDDGTITIISTLDSKYKEKTTDKQVIIGKVTDKGIETTTTNGKIIELSKKSAEEQKEQVTVTPKLEKSSKTTEETALSKETTTMPTQNSKTNTKASTDTIKTSTNHTSNETTSSNITNIGNQDTNTLSTSIEHKQISIYPTGKFVYEPNYAIQSQIINQIQSIISNDKTLTKRKATVTKGTKTTKDRFTFRGIGNHKWESLIKNRSGANYVYAEDEYSIMSDGSKVSTNMTYVSIYE